MFLTSLFHVASHGPVAAASVCVMEGEQGTPEEDEIVSRRLIIAVFVMVLLAVTPKAASAEWKVYYTGDAAGMFGSQGRGSFATQDQCNAYQRSRPGFERNNSYCSGFDTSSHQAGQSAPVVHNSGVKHYNSNDAAKMAVIQGLKNSLDEMTRSDPAAMQKFRDEEAENAQQLNQAQESAEQSEEARRQQAARREAAERSGASMELSGQLQGMPGPDEAPAPLDIGNTLSDDARRRQLAGMQLKSVQQSSSRAARAAVAGEAADPLWDEHARGGGEQGIDTKGRYAGALTSVEDYTAQIPKDKMTPKMQELLHQREEVREKQKDLAKKLSALNEKEERTPQDTVDIVKLQGEISQAHNMENYYDFSVNEELAKPAEEGTAK